MRPGDGSAAAGDRTAGNARRGCCGAGGHPGRDGMLSAGKFGGLNVNMGRPPHRRRHQLAHRRLLPAREVQPNPTHFTAAARHDQEAGAPAPDQGGG